MTHPFAPPLRLLAALVLLAACGSADRGTQPTEADASTEPLSAQRELVARLDRAIAWLDGEDAESGDGPGARDGLLLEARGVKNAGAERQGFHPDSASPGEFQETLALAADGGRIGYRYRHDRFDGTRESLHEVLGPDDARVIFVLDQGFAVNLRSPDHPDLRRRLARRFPSELLAEVRSRASGLRAAPGIGEDTVMSATLESGETVDLVFGPGPALRRVEYLTAAPGLGDTRVSWWFDDYRSVPGAGRIPHAYGVRLNGRAFTEMSVVRVSTDESAIAELLEPPAGIQIPDPQILPPAADASAGVNVREVAPGVFLALQLRSGFHPMFVEFEDFVLVADAPAGYPLWEWLPATDVAPGPGVAWLTERLIAVVEETIPGKPIRYAVITHFHNDHAGGARAMADAGATLLASPTAAPALRELLASPPWLEMGSGRTARAGAERVETVQGSRIITDGSRTVEVIDVGSNPHTRHMLVLRLPDEDIWFVSDLLDPTRVEAFPKPDHAALDRWFASWLDREGHAPERIYTMHGSALVTPEHLDRLR